MARGRSFRKRTRSSATPRARAGAATPKRRPRQLTTLVSALTKRVASAAKRRMAPASLQPAAATPVPFVPVARRSVVRKPAREPSVRIRRLRSKPVRPAAAPAAPSASAPLAPAASRGRLVPADAPPSTDSAPAAAAAPCPEEQYSLPAGYGDTRIVLMVKDPWWLYAYWEVQPPVERAARVELTPDEVVGLQTVLRVYDVTDVAFPDQPPHRWFDIPLSGLATNWYIHTNAPNRSFLVDIGLLTRSGRFLLLARSNRVTTPRAGPSDVIDEAWAIDDEAFWRLFGAAALGTGSSPSSWTLSQVSSTAWPMAGAAGWPAVQGFWCRVNTDLVIHGATEPRAKISIQGRPVPVRPDGTFTIRLAVPDGVQTITIDVTSADGTTTRTITPTVTLAWSGTLAPEPPRPSGKPADRRSSGKSA
jgi:hypothetical protein